jgi:hypothetical protein
MVSRMDLKVGDKVIFGRGRGEQTRGTILKLNPKKAKVRQDESRGRSKNHRIGNTWTVPYSLLRKDPTGGIPEAEVQAVIAEAKAEAEEFAPYGGKPATPPDTDSLVGRQIVSVRPMTAVELSREGWVTNAFDSGVALVLDNGAVLYPSRDSEGNGPGALFGSRKGKSFMVLAS